MRYLENRIPPPIVLLISIIAIRFIAQVDNLLLLPQSIRLVGAVLLSLLGIVIILSGVLAFKKANTTVNPLKPETASHLVVVGIFNISRNPMYLGMLFVNLAAACYYSSVLGLIAVVGFVMFISRFQIVPEERAMLKMFGEEFIAYKKKVRCWI